MPVGRLEVIRWKGHLEKWIRCVGSVVVLGVVLGFSSRIMSWPECDKCGEKMDNCNGRSTGVESRGYSCKSCFTRKSVRYGSFL